MRILIDVQDDRREAKTWLPEDDRDVLFGRVFWNNGTPTCFKHGAMNRVDPIRSIWRCSEFKCGVGAEIIEEV